ncbi:MAG: tripartite tricarboxylate transporter substrate binding protein [Arenimonas sp.]|jgi:tripartite-type tricarboxylate transporter receptor subunit TctC|nr:tripartite tricarboxylate transporter substrate binding protein [Arenimonas sp.]
MNRRDSIKATASLCLASTVGAAFAQVPAAPIRIIVPAAAGGTVDRMARMLAEAMRPKLGVVVVENKAGAAGLIGTKYVQNGPSDGRTLLFAQQGFISVPLVQPGGYEPFQDFRPVGIYARSPNFLMVHHSVPATTLPEFIAYAKSLPGGIDAANAGINSAGHLHTAWMARHAGIKVNHIPYKGVAETAQALLSGQVQMQLTATTEALNAQAREGKVRIIAMLTSRRDPVLAPGVPTVSETLPEIKIDGWYGLLMRASAPAEMVLQLNDALKLATADTATQAKLRPSSIALEYSTPEQMAAEMRASHEKYKVILRELDIRPA